MINIVDKTKCCGCEACIQICPKECISFKEDEEGFKYPLVDHNVCIQCELCRKVCPLINRAECFDAKKSIAAVNNDESQRMHSSSGGIFILLAEKFIENGGIVFGARFSEDFFGVKHVCVENSDDLIPLMGSKYLQSEIHDSFINVKKYLNSGKRVLFVGTPCQIAGLKNFLGRTSNENLLTVDILCHGVPSPSVWRKYLKALIARQGDEKITVSQSTTKNLIDTRVSGISFRNKALGWKNYSFAIHHFRAPEGSRKISVSPVSKSFRENPFMKGFLANLYLRPSCYDCEYRGEGMHCSDLTIGDLWGIGQIKPEIDDDKGLSLVMINTEKGCAWISDMNVLYELSEQDMKIATENNGGLQPKAKVNPHRTSFFRKFKSSKDIESLISKELQPTLGERLSYSIKRRLNIFK